MPDVDLSTVMADGDFLQRVGDELVGSDIATVYQPLDSDLTAIAALSTTAFGRSLLTLADAAAAGWTTDAELTAAQALKVNKAGDTMSGNLTVSATVAATVVNVTSNINVGAHALITGVMTSLNYRTGTGSPEFVVTAAVGTKYIDTAATAGAVEWVKAAGTGATGWRVVWGDTGWRVLTSWTTAGVVSGYPLGAGWAPRAGVAGGIYLRRINQDVYLQLSQLQAGTADPTGKLINAADYAYNPVYSPALATYVMGPVGAAAAICNFQVVVGGDVTRHTAPLPAGTVLYGPVLHWTTHTTTWPNPLPGTASAFPILLPAPGDDTDELNPLGD